MINGQIDEEDEEDEHEDSNNKKCDSDEIQVENIDGESKEF